MQKITNNMKRLLSSKHQALYKAGYLDGSLELTCVGHKVLEEILFEKFEDELVAKAKKDIEEEKKSKK